MSRCECCGADSAADYAQIERLLTKSEKSEIKELREAYDIVQDHLVKAEQRLREKDQLITELADALDQQSCWSTKVELIQRARKATTK